MSNVSQSYRVKRADFFDHELRSKKSISYSPINGLIYVNILAKKMKTFPDDAKSKIKKLWSHSQKKRIRLQNLGGESSKSKGFVIDNNNVVDGLTRRIDDWIQNELEKKKHLDPFIIEFFNTFIEHESYKNIVEEIAAMDKKNKCKCANLRQKKMSPMAHGSKVHQEIYDSVRYALKLSGLSDTKRPVPKRFHIDQCTKSCLLSLIKTELIPFTAEWPVFTNEGTGCATALDLICLDAKNNFCIKTIELKTGNVVKALKGTGYISKHKISYSQASIAAIQLLLSTFIGNKCYGNKYFSIAKEHAGESDFSNICNIIYIKSWGSIVLNIPKNICIFENLQKLYEHIIFKSASLRDNLSLNHNTQSHLTTKGTKRKKCKILKVGFN